MSNKIGPVTEFHNQICVTHIKVFSLRFNTIRKFLGKKIFQISLIYFRITSDILACQLVLIRFKRNNSNKKFSFQQNNAIFLHPVEK